MKNEEVHLVRGGELLAILRFDGRRLFSDHPCHEAACVTTPAFEPIRHLFRKELELLEVDADRENDTWADIWVALQAPGLFVQSPDGSERLAILWIHFKDDRAWWWPLYNNPNTILREPSA